MANSKSSDFIANSTDAVFEVAEALGVHIGKSAEGYVGLKQTRNDLSQKRNGVKVPTEKKRCVASTE